MGIALPAKGRKPFLWWGTTPSRCFLASREHTHYLESSTRTRGLSKTKHHEDGSILNANLLYKGKAMEPEMGIVEH